jgi:hypothetical protein
MTIYQKENNIFSNFKALIRWNGGKVERGFELPISNY